MDGVLTLHSEAVISFFKVTRFLIWILSSLLHHEFTCVRHFSGVLVFFSRFDGLVGELILFCYVCVRERGNMAFCRMDI